MNSIWPCNIRGGELKPFFVSIGKMGYIHLTSLMILKISSPNSTLLDASD